MWIAVGQAAPVMRSTDGIHWQEIPWQTFADKRKDFNGFHEVVFAGGLWVLGGGRGDFYTSPDGVNWTHRTTPDSRPLDNIYAIAYGDSGFVALGLNGDEDGYDNFVYTSPDGIQWTRHVIDSAYFIASEVAFGNGIYLAAGQGEFYRSADGLNWTALPQSGGHLFSTTIAYDGSGFWQGDETYDQSDTPVVPLYRSPNGENWQRAELQQSSGSKGYAIRDVDYSYGRYLAAGVLDTDNGTVHAVYRSVDGEDWVREEIDTGTHDAPALYGVTSGADLAVAVGSPGVIYARSLQGEDNPPTAGHEWTKVYPKRTSKELGAWTKAAEHNGIWIAVGENVPVVRSKDGGKTWKEVPWGRFASFKKDYFGFEEATYANGLWLVAGAHGNIYTSPDGLKWTRRTEKNAHPDDRLRAAAYGDRGFVAPGDRSGGVAGGYAYTSADGIRWVRHTLPGTAAFLDIAYGAGIYAAVGSEGFFVSEDGLAWTKAEDSDTGPSARSIVYDGNAFWAAGGAGGESSRLVLSKSYDGIDWFPATIRQSPQAQEREVRQMDYSNGRYLIAASETVNGRSDEVVYSSADGENWSRDVLNTPDHPQVTAHAVASGPSRSIAAGAPGVIYSREF
ncbi:hypothetical protein QWJ34_11335 [Saccharibacillus sp. CPCC 101409]|uniref:hypothetical protein n=1 Tax=Saccharibacillus sp. CPCC 101409 TaxID=3058041 RepID=UPI00267399F2|nr:hypothetical protein [Saccharibacillus sp. CPCC 101409]MDO3410356.1 hypothetical protein [Saccharibacillus sp. CPCC 101409]